MFNPKPKSFPASLQDELPLATIPDTSCLANFRLCLRHECVPIATGRGGSEDDKPKSGHYQKKRTAADAPDLFPVITLPAHQHPQHGAEGEAGKELVICRRLRFILQNIIFHIQSTFPIFPTGVLGRGYAGGVRPGKEEK